MQTDHNSVIGGYMPEQWEDTENMKSSSIYIDTKDITSGKPFLFYWVNDQIEIIKHRDKDKRIRVMGSDEDCPMVFGGGLTINVDQNEPSSAWAHKDYWVHP